MTKLLIISAWSDESQHESQMSSLKNQIYQGYKHYIIKNLGAIEAEREIHSVALNRIDEYDLILRFDGDMVFANKLVLGEAVKWFESPKNAKKSRLTLSVDDFFVNSPIIGAHFWRSTSTPWDAEIIPPKPERWIDLISPHTSILLRPGWILHAHNPSIGQSLRYGMHRALKAAELGFRHQHWRSLELLSRAYNANPQLTRRGIALLGAAAILGRVDFQGLAWNQIDHNSRVWQSLVNELAEIELSNFSAYQTLLRSSPLTWCKEITNSASIRHRFAMLRRFLATNIKSKSQINN